MTKKCYKCKKIKKTTEFYKKSSNTTDKLCGRCKKCDNVLKTIWRKNNLKKVKSYEKERWRTSGKRKKDLARAQSHRIIMSDSYIRELMTKKSKGLDPKDIPKDLIELHRATLALKRVLNLTPKLKGEED